jgi:uncharacterized protein (DUF1330 family)
MSPPSVVIELILSQTESCLIQGGRDNPGILEGDWPSTRTAKVRFLNGEEAMRRPNSPEYQKLAQHRFKTSRANIMITSVLNEIAT